MAVLEKKTHEHLNFGIKNDFILKYKKTISLGQAGNPFNTSVLLSGLSLFSFFFRCGTLLIQEK
jgi:hypothetical protein